MIAGAFNPGFFNSGLIYAWPEIFLSLAACAILMLDLLLNDSQRRWTGWLAIVSLIVTAVLVAVQPLPNKVLALGGLFELDRMAQILKLAMILIVAAVFVYSTDYLQRRLILKGEYFVL
jgi:NADH-quinone oxidoreductase subunit N